MIDKKNISTILFDLGGVLIQLHGGPFKPSWLTNATTGNEVWSLSKRSEAVRLFESGSIDSDEFVAHFMKWPARLFPGVEQMLQELAQSYRLAALSNSNALHWPMVMQDMRLQEYIPDCFASHQIQAMKPDRKAFDTVLDRMDVRPEEVLFLDDLQVSIDMATELGMQAVKVTGTTGGVETVRSLKLIQQ
jgi:putative hydrolase of the HAD superfamily